MGLSHGKQSREIQRVRRKIVAGHEERFFEKQSFSVVQIFLRMCSRGIYIMVMTTTLQAWGNSQGVRIPKALLAALQLKTGMSLQVELSPKKDAIIVKPAKKTVPVRGRHKIENLLSKMPRNYKAHEFFSEPSGREVW